MWPGHVTTTPRWVVPPHGHVSPALCREFVGRVWAPSEAASDAILEAAFPPAALALVRASRHCVSDGCSMTLDAPSYRALSRTARGELSRAFGAWTQNTFYAMPMHRPEGTPRFDQTPGLPDDARAALRAISWDDLDNGESVSRPGALCDANLPDASLIAALAALWTVPSMELTVRVDHDDEIDGVARYWAWGRDPRALAAQLRADGSLQRGAPLSQLLPEPFASRVYTYADREGDHHNCLNAVLCDDGRCPDMVEGAEADARLARGFHRVSSLDELRAGDVVVWRDESGVIVHGAAWLASRLLFTKNGVSYLRPWHVAPFDAIQRSYRNATRAEYWRRNDEQRRPAS